MRIMINKTKQNINEVILTQFVKAKIALNNCNGFGLSEVLGIAGVCIVAAFVIIPGLRTFSGSIMSGMNGWWTNSIQPTIFPTT